MQKICFYLFLILFAACNNSESKIEKPIYEDLNGFFESEAIRLIKKNVFVNKTVEQNGSKESQEKISINWENELSLFKASDINKPAWRDGYKILTDSLKTTYLAKDSKLRTKEIQIEKDLKGEIKRIFIKNISENYLYKSTELLSYFPDSLYVIEKHQDVIILGDYQILVKAKMLD